MVGQNWADRDAVPGAGPPVAICCPVAMVALVLMTGISGTGEQSAVPITLAWLPMVPRKSALTGHSHRLSHERQRDSPPLTEGSARR